MLFDPPSLRTNSASHRCASAPVLPPCTRDQSPTFPPGKPRQRLTPALQPAACSNRQTTGSQNARQPRESAGARQVTVRPGDNASKIAAQNKPASVSLDQMLVALLRGNPDAFVGGNINVIKSGAVVDIPDEQAATRLSPGEARQTLIAQSRDFNTFRRKLADGVPATQVDSADRQAGGKVQAKVDDRAQASRLTRQADAFKRCGSKLRRRTVSQRCRQPRGGFVKKHQQPNPAGRSARGTAAQRQAWRFLYPPLEPPRQQEPLQSRQRRPWLLPVLQPLQQTQDRHPWHLLQNLWRQPAPRHLPYPP